ncbi:MAG: histidine phosphatase family protein [Vicinamibacterales bacterium]
MRAIVAVVAVACCVLLAEAQTPDAGTLRIYLARHGESEANLARTLAGWLDTPLTARGRQQANDMAVALRGTPFDAVYSSTLVRSRVTAEILAPGAQVQALPELRERSVGRFEGKPNNDPEYLRRVPSDEDDLDGGEPRTRVLERVREALSRIQRANASGTVLVVGHANTNRMILRALLGLSPEQANAVAQDNDELYVLELGRNQSTRLFKLIREKNLGDL